MDSRSSNRSSLTVRWSTSTPKEGDAGFDAGKPFDSEAGNLPPDVAAWLDARVTAPLVALDTKMRELQLQLARGLNDLSRQLEGPAPPGQKRQPQMRSSIGHGPQIDRGVLTQRQGASSMPPQVFSAQGLIGGKRTSNQRLSGQSMDSEASSMLSGITLTSRNVPLRDHYNREKISTKEGKGKQISQWLSLAAFNRQTNFKGTATGGLGQGKTLMVLREADQEVVRQKGMLNPESKARLTWDIGSLIALMLDLVLLPLMLAWTLEGTAIEIIGLILLIFWASDVIMNFRTGVYVKGRLRMDAPTVARQYLKGSFLLDLCIVSVDILVTITARVGCEGGACSLRMTRMLKGIRLVRLLRQPRFVKVMEKLTERYATGEANTYMYEVLKLIFCTMWVCHFTGCIWLSIGYFPPLPSESGMTWVDIHPELAEEQDHKAFQYLTSFNWALCQMVSGAVNVHPTNSTERAWSILCRGMGFLFTCCLVSGFTARITRQKIQNEQVKSKLLTLRRFLHQISAEPDLVARAVKQAKARLNDSRVLSVCDISALDMVSSSLRGELHFKVSNKILLRHRIFNVVWQVNEHALRELSDEALTFSNLGEDEILFFPKTDARAAYQLRQGRLTYMIMDSSDDRQDDVILTVQENAWISEAALWCKWQHAGHAQVSFSTECEFVEINPDAMAKVLLSHSVIRSFVTHWASAFQEKLCGHSHAEFNDVDIPDVSAVNVLAALPAGPQAYLSMAALKVYADGASYSPFGRHVVTNVTLLEKEIVKGRAALYLNDHGELERMTTIAAIALTYSDGDGMKVFAELGKVSVDGFLLSSKCRLPGIKCTKENQANKLSEFTLATKLPVLKDCIEIKDEIRKVQTEKSEKYGISTRYDFTIYKAELGGVWDAPTGCVFSKDVEIDVCGIREIDIFIMGSAENGQNLYAWLTADEYEYFTGDELEDVLRGPRSQHSMAVQASPVSLDQGNGASRITNARPNSRATKASTRTRTTSRKTGKSCNSAAAEDPSSLARLSRTFTPNIQVPRESQRDAAIQTLETLLADALASRAAVEKPSEPKEDCMPDAVQRGLEQSAGLWL